MDNWCRPFRRTDRCARQTVSVKLKFRRGATLPGHQQATLPGLQQAIVSKWRKIQPGNYITTRNALKMNTIIIAGNRNAFFYEEKVLIGRCVEPKSKRILKRVSRKFGPQGILQRSIILLSLVSLGYLPSYPHNDLAKYLKLLILFTQFLWTLLQWIYIADEYKPT